MSKYRFVSFVPVVGEKLRKHALYRLADRKNHCDDWFPCCEMMMTEWMLNACEFIRPADSESPAEPVPAAFQSIPAMTVREQFALAAMKSLTLKGGCGFEAIALMAVSIADCTIRELAKPKVTE